MLIVDNHNKTTQKTFTQIQNLLSETEKFLQLMEDASTSLKQAAEPVKQSTLLLTRNLTATSEQMKNLSDANQITRQNLIDLSAKIKNFMDNFDGIANEFERSAKIIRDSLENYNVKTNAGLKEKLEAFDKSMSQAFGYLNELTEDLNNAMDDFKKFRR